MEAFGKGFVVKELSFMMILSNYLNLGDLDLELLILLLLKGLVIFRLVKEKRKNMKLTEMKR
jgi:hypothetical protein